MNLVQHRGSKGKPTGQGMQKCYAYGRPGHIARDKVCPARGVLCAKCGKRGHWATCCRNEADGKGKSCKSDGRGSDSNNWRSCGATSGRNLKPRGQQVNQVDYDSEEEPYEVPEEMNGSMVFSKLDMNMRFHQIELEERSRDIKTFSAGDSLYRYKRLSFGENSAPEQYQNIIRQKIDDCPGVTNIADDIVVYRRTYN